MADDSLMKELDGWRAQGRLLQFTFDKDLAAAYGADLISPGSYRLNTILQLIRKQGILSRCHIPHHFFHEANIRKKILSGLNTGQKAYVVNSSFPFSQYLQLEILVEAIGLQKKESIHTVVVNLSSGEIIKFAIPTHLLNAGGVATDLIMKRKCSFKKAYTKATDYLSEVIANEDQTWAKEAAQKLAQEEEKLRDFFKGQNAAEDFAAKQQELRRRLKPSVVMDTLRGAIIFIPCFSYRLMVVEPNGSEKIRQITYDPIANLRDSN